MDSVNGPDILAPSVTTYTSSNNETLWANIAPQTTAITEKACRTTGVTSAALKGAPSCSKSLDANLFGKSEEPQTPAPAVVRKALSKALSGYVTILLDCGKEFHLRRELLNSSSEYFAAMFRNPNMWIESNSGKIQLSDIEEHTFTIFKEWLETGNISTNQPVTQTPSQIPSSENHTSTPQLSLPAPVMIDILRGNKDAIVHAKISNRLDLLIECYILGNYLKLPAFQNKLMDSIMLQYYEFWSSNNGIPLHNLPFITLHTTDKNPLRQFILDLISSSLSDINLRLAADKDLIPNELVLDIAAAGLGQELCRTLPWDSWGCTYHLHPEGEFRSPCDVSCNWSSDDGVTWSNWDAAGDSAWVRSEFW